MVKKIFECRRCGFCCQGESTVSLSPEERRRIADFLGLGLQEFLTQYCRQQGNRVEMKVVNGHCIFYDTKDSLCRIHPVKPFHCKRWPLHPAILESLENYQTISSTCPGFNPQASYEEICAFVRGSLENPK
ncbi:YkgJ family cysteine cluster protein [Thermosulfuriphilus ammonigenes]|uniref:YkgJ family cysteine cluster protein n=1 Tax=Thermosulfuriphilus ammonigenes TaxID=1936021 RepID=A0A6G7PY03_9BACT|nr:YkgJ family cysteine cluster protein [Thermosulfuriphilus ammonigenes]HFB83395.1 YkgJ family cysteine cluster protein [Thermodesulfatator sp.]